MKYPISIAISLFVFGLVVSPVHAQEGERVIFESFGRRTLDYSYIQNGLRRTNAYSVFGRRASLATVRRRQREESRFNKEQPMRYKGPIVEEKDDPCIELRGISAARCKYNERVKKRIADRWARRNYSQSTPDSNDGVQRLYGEGTEIDRLFPERRQNRDPGSRTHVTPCERVLDIADGGSSNAKFRTYCTEYDWTPDPMNPGSFTREIENLPTE